MEDCVESEEGKKEEEVPRLKRRYCSAATPDQGCSGLRARREWHVKTDVSIRKEKIESETKTSMSK